MDIQLQHNCQRDGSVLTRIYYNRFDPYQKCEFVPLYPILFLSWIDYLY